MIVSPGFFEIGEARYNDHDELVLPVQIKNDGKTNLTLRITAGWLELGKGVQVADNSFFSVKTSNPVIKAGQTRTVSLVFSKKTFKEQQKKLDNAKINPVAVIQTVEPPSDGTNVSSAVNIPLYVFKQLSSVRDSEVQPVLTLKCDGQHWVFWSNKISCTYTIVNNPLTPLRLRNQLTVKKTELRKVSLTTELLDKHRIYFPSEEVSGNVKVNLKPFARNQLQVITIASNDQTAWRVASTSIDRIYVPWYTGSLLLAFVIVLLSWFVWRRKKKAYAQEKKNT